MSTPTVRAHLYTSDPLVTFVQRVPADDEYQDYYDLPEDLVARFETAERSLVEARDAIQKHIDDNQLTEREAPFWTERETD